MIENDKFIFHVYVFSFFNYQINWYFILSITKDKKKNDYINVIKNKILNKHFSFINSLYVV